MSKPNSSIKKQSDNTKTIWKVIYDFSNENGWWFYWILLGVIITPFILYYILIIKSPIGTINSAYVGSFIAYFGSIIGGSFTLIGVILTIRKQSENQELEFKQREKARILEFKQREEARIAEQKIIYKPFIELSLKNKNLETFDDKHFFFKISLTNIGRGELYLKSVKIESKNDTLHQHFSFNYYPQEKVEKNIILPKETLDISCDNGNLLGEKIDKVTCWELFYFIYYYDLFNDEVFSKEFKKSYIVNFDKSIIEEDDINNIQ